MPSAAAVPWRTCAGSPTRTCACSTASASSSRMPRTSCAPRSRSPSVTPSWSSGPAAPERAEDARIVVDELQRLRRLADRLLLLATSEDPDFLARSPVQVEHLLAAILQRWAPIVRRWRLDPIEPAAVVGDADRLGLA